MKYEKGTFGKFGNNNEDGDSLIYGFYKCDEYNHVCGEYSKDGLIEPFYRDTFTPCHEPLPLEPTFEEWAKAYMILIKEIRFIYTASGYTYCNSSSGDHHVRLGEIPKNWNKENCITRNELFPESEPEPDWIQYIGCFGKFYNYTEDNYIWGYLTNIVLKNKKPISFIEENGLNWRNFKPGLPSERIELPDKKDE